MRNKRLVTWVLVPVLIVISAFYTGTRYQAHRPQFQAFLASFASLDRFAVAHAQVAVAVPPVEASAAAQAIAPPAPPAPPEKHSRHLLETTLLPLRVDTVALPEALGVHPGSGGGMTVVNDTIVVVDLRGGFFKIEGKGEAIEALPLPRLPNHADDYDQYAPKPKRIDGGFMVNVGFRVHDVESRTMPDGVELFVSYERYLPELRTTCLAVSSIVLGAKDFRPRGSWQDVYEGQPVETEWYSGVAGGGRMVVHDDNLYLTVGDYNQDNVFMHTELMAQDLDNDFGKILKIDLRTKAKTILSIGHRNPQGLAITSQGTIYATEHGPLGGDELNKIVAGKNYGWPLTTLGTHYTTYDWPNRDMQTAHRKFEKPVFAWLPSIGISNLIEVSNFNAAWDHDLLVESLKANSLYRLRRDGEGKILYSEPIPLGHRLRDIAALPDGTLVLWTDDAKLIFVNVDTAKLATNRRLEQ
jgi:hypothetical protein